METEKKVIDVDFEEVKETERADTEPAPVPDSGTPLDDLADLFGAVAKPMKRLGFKHADTVDGLAGDMRGLGKAVKKLDGLGERVSKFVNAGESKRTMPPPRRH